MEKAGKILMIASTCLLFTCVSDFEKVAPPTELVVHVETPSGVALDGADAYIFDDLTVFNQSVSSGVPAGFVSKTQSVAGTARFTQLNSESSYYLYVSYKDNVQFPGTFITYDNSVDNFTLKNKLTRGSVSYLSVVLKPVDGLITFWTANTNTAALPINVFFGNSSVGTVTQSFSSSPALFSAGALTIRNRMGTVTFEGKSASGCLWTNTIALAGSQSVSYQLEDCSVGTIAFYTDNTNLTKLPITLTLNANDALPNLTSVVSSVPADCAASNLVEAIRVPGTYTYQATSPSGNCLWAGSFILTANQCKLITLPTCL